MRDMIIDQELSPDDKMLNKGNTLVYLVTPCMEGDKCFKLKICLRQNLQKGKSVFTILSLYDYGHCPHFPHLPTFPRSKKVIEEKTKYVNHKNVVVIITATRTQSEKRQINDQKKKKGKTVE